MKTVVRGDAYSTVDVRARGGAGLLQGGPLDEVCEHHYALTPGRDVGAEDVEDDDKPFEEKFPRLVKRLEEQFAKGRELEETIWRNLEELSYGN